LSVRNDHRNGIDIKPHNYEQKLFDPDFMFYNKLFNEKDLYVKCDQYRQIVRKAGEKVEYRIYNVIAKYRKRNTKRGCYKDARRYKQKTETWFVSTKAT